MRLSKSRTKQSICITHTLLFVILITIVISTIYSNTLYNEFHLDDFHNIVENTYIHIKSLSLPVLKDAAFNEAAYRRPVTNVTFALNYYFGELDVFGYHLVNIIIHIITSITIYLFLYITLEMRVQGTGCRVQKTKDPCISDRSFWIGMIAALLWSTSPVQTQAVTYIVQRATSMATMFYMMSLLCYVNGRVSGGRGHPALYYLLSTVFAFLAFGTKEISVTLPLIIILYEIYFFAKFSPVAVKKISLYFGIMLILFTMVGLLYIGTVKDGGIIESITSLIKERSIEGEEFTSVERLMTEFRVVIHYITLLVLPLPSRLRFKYDFPVSHSLFNPMTTFICLSIIIGIIGYAIHISRRRPVISFFILWFFINLAIESTVIRLWLVFEHRLYLPSIGFFVIIAIGIVKLMDIVKSSRKSSIHNYLLPTTYYCFLIGIILTQSVWTIQRNSVWKTKIARWEDTKKKSPNLSEPHFFLAGAYKEIGKVNLAIKEYKEAIRLKPDYSDAYNNLGGIYFGLGEVNMAINEYKEAIKYEPYHLDAHYNLGVAYNRIGAIEKAKEKYIEVIMINRNYDDAYNNLGEIYIKEGKIDLAIKKYKEALKIDPAKKNSYINLGTAYGMKGNTELALQMYEKALSIDSKDPQIYFNLGIVYEVQGRIELALEKYKRALELNPNITEARDKIAALIKRVKTNNEAKKLHIK